MLEYIGDLNVSSHFGGLIIVEIPSDEIGTIVVSNGANLSPQDHLRFERNGSSSVAGQYVIVFDIKGEPVRLTNLGKLEEGRYPVVIVGDNVTPLSRCKVAKRIAKFDVHGAQQAAQEVRQHREEAILIAISTATGAITRL